MEESVGLDIKPDVGSLHGPISEERKSSLNSNENADAEYIQSEEFSVSDSENATSGLQYTKLEEEEETSDTPVDEKPCIMALRASLEEYSANAKNLEQLALSESSQEKCVTSEDRVLSDCVSTSNSGGDEDDSKIPQMTMQMECQEHSEASSDAEYFRGDGCKKAFTIRINLKPSKTKDVSDRPHKCSLCDKSFTHKWYLTSHMRSHSREKSKLTHFNQQEKKVLGQTTFQDDIRVGLINDARLQEAVSNDSLEPEYACDKCDKSFNTKAKLNKHKQTHTSLKLFKCDECDKSFGNQNGLSKHKKRHLGLKPFKCDECDKSFTQNSKLVIHKRTHSGDKPYKCDDCDKSFVSCEHLNKHRRIHLTLRPFNCDECDKSFTQKSRLTIHKRMHSGLKPYKCDICDKSFASCGLLTKHKKRHLGLRPFTCDECGKSYTGKCHLVEHKKTHLKVKLYKCDEFGCDKRFFSSELLAKHKKRHLGLRPYTCDECGKSFAQNCELTVHKRTHAGVRPYKCDQCDKDFTSRGHLTKHEKIHLGLRPFRCDVCDKRFTQSSNLTAHKKIHSRL